MQGTTVAHEQQLKRIRGWDNSGGLSPVRIYVKMLRRKLGDNARNPSYVFTVPRVGRRTAKGEERETSVADLGSGPNLTVGSTIFEMWMGL